MRRAVLCRVSSVDAFVIHHRLTAAAAAVTAAAGASVNSTTYGPRQGRNQNLF